MEDYIEHHGVKGQKWGIRRKSDKKVVIKKGSTIYRVSEKPNEELGTESKFVTTNLKDSNRYMKDHAAFLGEIHGLDAVYNMKMTAVHDLISPSVNERAKMYIDIYKSTPSVRKRVANNVMRSDPNDIPTQILNAHPRNAKKVEKIIKKGGEYSLNDPRILKLVSKSYMFDKNARSKVDKYLSSHGYNSMVDDNDAGSFGDAPFVVLKPYLNLKMKDVDSYQMYGPKQKGSKGYYDPGNFDVSDPVTDKYSF